MSEPASQNPYMYCKGNPIKYSDPSGYETLGEAHNGADAVEQGVMPLGIMHRHHLLPQAKEFRDFFKDARLDIEKYTVNIPDNLHIKKPEGVHTGKFEESWNGEWRKYKEANKGKQPSAKKILKFLKEEMIDKKFPQIKEYAKNLNI